MRLLPAWTAGGAPARTEAVLTLVYDARAQILAELGGAGAVEVLADVVEGAVEDAAADVVEDAAAGVVEDAADAAEDVAVADAQSAADVDAEDAEDGGDGDLEVAADLMRRVEIVDNAAHSVASCWD